MAFDPASARPVGFDPASAKPAPSSFDPGTAEEVTASWADTLKSLPSQFIGRAEQTVGGMARAIGEADVDFQPAMLMNPVTAGAELARNVPGMLRKAAPETFENITEAGTSLAEIGSGRIQYDTPENQTFLQKAVSTAAQSAGQAVPLAMAAFATRSPGLVAAGFGAQEFGRAYGEGRAKGLSEDKAFRYASLNGLIEAGTEFLPAKQVFKQDQGLLKRFVNFMAAELPGENVAEIGQAVNEWANGLREDLTVKDIIDTMALTSAATLIGGSGQATAAHYLEKVTKQTPPPPEATPEDIINAPPESLDSLVEQELAEPELPVPDIEQFHADAAKTEGDTGEVSRETSDRRATTRETPDRRAQKRELLKKMSPEEREIMLTSDAIPALPGKNAFEMHMEENPGQRVMFLDYDDFKAVNDKRGEKLTDRTILEPSGEIMQEIRAQFPDVSIFHRSGDEFLATGASDERLQEFDNALRERLKTAKFEATLPNGTIDEHTGIGYSRGFGQDEETARAAAKLHKAERKASGERTGARDAPKLAGPPPAGNQVPAGQVNGKISNVDLANAADNQSRAGTNVPFDPTTARPTDERIQEEAPAAEAQILNESGQGAAVSVAESQARATSEPRDGEVTTAQSSSAPDLQTETPTFKKWFGESKVVDADGKPLVVYHGTADDFDSFSPANAGKVSGTPSAQDGFFFSRDPDTANIYAREAAFSKDREAYELGAKGNIVPVYLSIKNPKYVEHGESVKSEVVKKAKAEGHDGVIDARGDYVVFKPEQIKSAIGNRGTFDEADPNILHANPVGAVYKGVKRMASQAKNSLFPPPNYGVGFQDWAPPNSMLGFISDPLMSREGVAQRLRAVRRKLQDKFVAWKDVQEQIKNRGGSIDDISDAYNRFTMIEGRVGDKFRKVFDNYIKPILDDMARFNITMEELDQYLYAKFAPQRNRRIARINPDLPDGGSGMTNAEAEAYVKSIPPDRIGKLERLADRVYAMQRLKLNILVANGRMSADTRDELLKDTRYVPLKGFAEAGDMVSDSVGIGRGFDQAQDLFKRAKGRQSKAADIFATAVRDIESGIINAEKNRVGQSVLNLVLKNPNEKLWKVNPIKVTRAFNSRTGQVEMRVSDDYKVLARDQNVFVTWSGGKPYAIKFMDGPMGGESALARSLKNMGVDNVPWFMSYLARYNRWLSMINTSLNPEFLLTNPIRDIQTALAKTYGDYDAKIVGQVMKNMPKAVKGAIGGIMESKTAKNIAANNPKWVNYYSEYAAEGGKTDYFRNKSVKEMQEELDSELAAAAKGAKGSAIRVFRKTFKAIENGNAVLENMTRLSLFITLRENGYSAHQAAAAAKNLTVNFNRKGEAGAIINSMYLFYNASLQGAHLTLRLMRNPKVQKLMLVAGAGMIALTQYNILMGGDDDDGEPNYFKNVPDYEKQRNIIIMWPDGSGRYFKIPMPYGLNVPMNAAAALAHVANGRDKMEQALWVAASAWNSFSPVGENGWNILAPTILDPFVDISLNRDYAERPIMPAENPYAEIPLPDSQRAFRNTSPIYKNTAEWLNRVGGDEQKPGYVDVSPESIKHMTETFTGGLGGFMSRTTEFMFAEEKEAARTPFVRRFYGEPSPFSDRQRYEEHKDHIFYLHERAEFLRKKAAEGSELEKKEYLTFKNENTAGLGLFQELKQAEGKIKGKYEQRKHLQKNEDANQEKILKAEQDMKDAMKQFNKQYNDIFLDRGIMESFDRLDKPEGSLLLPDTSPDKFAAQKQS